MAKAPNDQAARDRIRTDLRTTLFVEAGAGTGKTTSLVNRLVELLTTEDESLRATVDQVAAITFTDKAASELRGRLRKELDKTARGEGPKANAAQEALLGLEAAAIETIHAFAGRILRQCALEIDLPPAFEVRDEISAQVTFDDWWEDTLEKLLQDPELEADWESYFEAGLELKHLRQWTDKLQANCERISAPLETVSDIVDSVLGNLEAITTESCGVPEDKLEVRLRELAAFAERFRATPAQRQRLDVLASLKSTPIVLNLGSAKNWGAERLSALKASLGEIRVAMGLLEGAIRANMAAPIFEHVRQAVVAYADQRRREGTLEFQDLLILAAQAARLEPVQKRLRETYRRVLVDEFQDTDPLQLTLVEALSGGEPGRLFFVGDPRQSIYRFRRADIELFRDQREAIPNQDRVRLSDNFRSKSNIIAWSNTVLGNLLKADEEGLEGLTAAREEAGLKVRLLGDELEVKADEVREQEAEEVARTIQALRAEGKKLSDIAILFPSRAILFFLERAFLRYGIPFRIESKSLLFETQEARDLFAILRAVEDPSDPIAVVAALRTSAFGCSDQDLYDHVEAKEGFNYLKEVTGESPVQRGLIALKGYFEQRLTMPVAELAGKIVRERLMFELGLASNRPRDVWQRYTMVLDRIRAFDESTHGTLRQFLRWADNQIDRRASMNERIVAEEDDDAVRLMTIHAAKGLEFPIVFVSGLSGGEQIESGVRVTWDEEGRLHFCVKVADIYVTNTGTKAAFRRDKDLSDFESNRVLYVGCTRARDELYVSLYHPKKHADDSVENLGPFRCLAKRVCDNLSGSENWCERWAAPESSSVTAIETWPAPPAENREAWEARRRAVFEAGEQRAIAATTIAKNIHDQLQERDIEESEPRPRGKGTEFGLAVHGALQYVSLLEGTAVEALARAHAKSAVVSAVSVEKAVQAALASEPVQRAARNPHWKEVFASAQVEGVLLEGIIDLLYEDADGLHVIDYKTDANASASGRATAMDTYRYQAGTYALVLEQTTGKPVCDCTFVFLQGGGEALECLAGEALEEAKQGVREWLRGAP